MRLETLFAGHAARRPNHAALVCGAQRLSYSELQQSVLRLASGLHRLGVRPRDRVLIYLPNGIEFVQMEYAVFAVGAIAVPVNMRLTSDEIEHITADAEPVLAAFHAEGRSAVQAGLRRVSTCRAVVVGEACEGEIPFAEIIASPAGELPALRIGVDASDDCLIMYTSGTTGKPKGAVITHANMVVQNVYIHGLEWGIGRDDRFVVLSPLAHRAGISRLYNALGLGGTLVIMDKFDAARTLETIERERITVAGFVPTVIRMMLPLLRANPASCASLRRIIISTEACPVALKQELIELIPNAEIHSVFAMTEALVTDLDHAGQFTHPASVGRAIPGVEIRIVGAEGREVSCGEAGEILVRSGAPGRYATIAEYFRQPEATAAAIRDGWFHTGDMGRQDNEGYLYIVDRKKDMVISGGFNIYSKEVEQVLATHPDIVDAAVIGVPDEIFGEAVAAFIETKPGARLDAGQVVEHCREHLAGYKKPKHIYFIDALPRNSTGKVLKFELRKLASQKALQS
jgi:long-chain acyl-CoA synthetase